MNLLALLVAGSVALTPLPAPTGEHAVGIVSLRMVDRSRTDSLGDKPFRELMVDIRYPARETAGRPVPQFTAKEAAAFGELAGRLNYGVEPGAADWGATRTHAYRNARAARGKWPVVLYSAGLGDGRMWNSALADDLASRGYVVVSVDHTYESSGVEFPGGRLERGVVFDREPTLDLLRTLLATRVADVRFVLDELSCFGNLLDLDRVAVVGHSAGGFTALQAMYEDRRIKAAVNFDGQLSYGFADDGTDLADVARYGLDRPFALVGSHEPGPSWTALMAKSPGRYRLHTPEGARHSSFTDAEILLRGDSAGLAEWSRDTVARFLDNALP